VNGPLEDGGTLLRTELEQLGGTPISDARTDRGGEAIYRIGELEIHVISEYGATYANVALDGGRLFPASFWLAALDGDSAYPHPAVTDRDLARLASQLPDLVRTAPNYGTPLPKCASSASRR
jgi:hypothetical protein